MSRIPAAELKMSNRVCEMTVGFVSLPVAATAVGCCLVFGSPALDLESYELIVFALQLDQDLKGGSRCQMMEHAC
jgi:hypothetical protein